MKKILHFVNYFWIFFRKGFFPGVLVVAYKIEKGRLQLLLVKNDKKNVVTFPSGFVDSGESYKEAASRELYEETGYNTNALHPTSINYSFRHKNLPFKLKVIQKVFTVKLKPREYNGLKTYFAWYNFNLARNILSYPELKEILDKVKPNLE